MQQIAISLSIDIDSVTTPARAAVSESGVNARVLCSAVGVHNAWHQNLTVAPERNARVALAGALGNVNL